MSEERELFDEKWIVSFDYSGHLNKQVPPQQSEHLGENEF
jgi:hypothetical protein